MRILPESMYSHWASSLGAGSTVGTISNVFRERIARQAAAAVVPLPDVLGAAMAHELFHALTGDEYHSDEGIMRAVWDRTALIAISRGGLRFSQTELAKMRTAAAH
jgi:hypothetical protein